MSEAPVVSAPERRRTLRRGASLLLAAACTVAWSGVAQAEPLSELVARADRILRGKTSAAVLRMDIKTKSFSRSYKMVIWDDASAAQEKTLIKILGPASFRGYATLRLGGQLKFYDPKTDHVQVVGSSMLGDSWMGSHFSNDDLVKETRLARDYDASLLETHQGDNGLGQSATFSRIKLVPKPSAPVSWGRIEFELWQSGSVIMPVSTDYFTKPGDAHAARQMSFGGVKQMDGRWVPSELTVTVASKPGEFTKLTYETLRFNVQIPANKFTEQALR